MLLKKGKRILKITLITLGALLSIIILVALFWLGPTIKLITQTIGPKALGTPLNIESLSINPRKGLIHLSGFTLANPGSFGQSNAVSLVSLDIAVDMASLFSQTVLVHQVQINSPHFIFEQSSATDNIAEYIRSIEDFIGYDPAAPPDPKAEKKKQKKREKKEKKRKKREQKPPKIVMVQSLEINDAQFLLAHTHNPKLDIVLGLGQLSFSMTNGVVQLKNIQVENPGSLASTELLKVDEIRVDLDPATIHHPPLSIVDVQIVNPHCFVEWAHDANTISEFLQISDLTRTRVQDWPLPKKDPAEEPVTEIPETAAETDLAAPPPEIHNIGITNFQFHLVNSVDTHLSIRVMLDNLTIGLSEGAVEFGRFSVSNPGRLATPDLFSLDGIDIRFDPATIHSNTLSISDIQVLRPYMFLESNPETDTVNELMKIADTITQTMPTNRAAKAGTAVPIDDPPVESTPNTPAAAPVALHNMLISDIQVKLLDTTTTNAPADPRMLAGIHSISIRLVDGKLQVNEITVPNPGGFFETNLFHLANIDIAIDPESIFSDQIVIQEIFVDSPIINLEQTETTGNVAELQKSLMAFTPPGEERSSVGPDETPETGATNAPAPLAAQPVILESLCVTNLAVHAILQPPFDPASTNEPSGGGMIGSLERSVLNPMTHIQGDDTNNVAAAENDEITLLGFDLLTVKALEGTVDISNLRIGNPPNFSNEHLVKIEQFHLTLEPDSMTTDTLLIKEILIQKPRVAYERKIMTDNIKMFEETIQGAVHRRGETMDKVPEEEAIETEEGQKLIIEHLLVQDGIVKAKISALPTAPIPLPAIEMTDIGKEAGGASLGDASSKIFDSFYDAIIGVVANTTGLAGDALKGAGALTADTLSGLGGLIGLDGEKKAEEPKEAKPKKRKNLFRNRTHK